MIKMKVGRNEPCPCGSGKKHKKCCLQKERERIEAERRKERARKGYWDRFWRRFNAADHVEKISIFGEYLGGSDVNADVAFDMLTELLKDARKLGDYHGFAELVAELKEKHPEIYSKDAAFYSCYLVENMVLQAKFDGLEEVLEPFASEPEHIDEFFRVIELLMYHSQHAPRGPPQGLGAVIELLMYHSQTSPLLGVMVEAYPGVMRSEEILPPGKEEFSDLLGWLILLNGLEKDEEDLSSRVSRYWRTGRKSVEDVVALLKGGASSNWSRADFVKGSAGKEKIMARVVDLIVELLPWLKHWGMGYSRALLARAALMEYLFEKEHYSQLKRGDSVLLPDRRVLDRYLATCLTIFNSHPYHVAAVVEALPHYLSFLLHKGLITEEEFRQAIKRLRPLVEDVLNYFRRSSPLNAEILRAIEESWRLDAPDASG